MALGEKIRDARKALHMTQKNLAGDHFSAAFISQVERNVITPSLASLSIIAERLGHPVSHFLESDLRDRQNEVDLLINLGKVYTARGDLPQAADNLARASEIAVEIHDSRRVATAAKHAAVVEFYSGAYDAALERFREAAGLFRTEGVFDEVASCTFSLGSVCHFKHDYEQAIEHYLDCLAQINLLDLRDVPFKVKVLGNLGNAYCRIGDYEQGTMYHEQALALSADVQDFLQMGQNYMSLSLIYRDGGQLDRALDYSQRGLEIFESLENFRFLATLHVNIGIINADKGQWEEAAAHYREAIHISQRTGSRRNQAYACTELAKYHRHRGETDQATECCQQSLELLSADGDDLEIARIHQVLGLIARDRKDFATAVRESMQAADLLRSTNSPQELANVLYDLGELLMQTGDKEGALSHYQQALALFRGLGDVRSGVAEKVGRMAALRMTPNTPA
jgi:tetratricopeptide (TPR) repeat protein